MTAYERRASTILFNLLTSGRAAGLIILPANVCPIVPLTIHKAGLRFEFVDISQSTLCIDHDKLLERWISGPERPSGLVYVRTYGAIFDAAALFNEIKRLTPNALIIDDRCTCVPSFSPDSLIESVDAVLYSTGYAKYADIGFGGYAFLRDCLPYGRAKLPYEESALQALTAQYKEAVNEKVDFEYSDSAWLDFDDPAVPWAMYQRTVEAQVNRVANIKQAINNVYTSKLPPEIQFSEGFQDWRFNIHVADKIALMTAIAESGLFASGHYAALDGSFGRGSGQNARALYRHVVNLFNDAHFDLRRANRLADLICNIKGLAPSQLSV